MSQHDPIDLTEAFQSLEPALLSDRSKVRLRKEESQSFRDPPTHHRDEEIRLARLYDGTTIKVGESVELFNDREGTVDTLQSGDFLRVQHIIRDTVTNEVRLRGLKLMRCMYYHPVFDFKRNELVLVLNVFDDDARSPFVQGQEEVALEEVLRKREIVLSHRPYETQVEGRKRKNDTFHSQMVRREFIHMSHAEKTSEIFHNLRLVCRTAHILRHTSEGKFYSGEARLLYRLEGDFPLCTSEFKSPGASRKTSISIEDDEKEPPNHFSSQSTPTTAERMTFGDMFCCSGGASQGAVQADLKPVFGLDKDNIALQIYHLNHPESKVYIMDAHDISLIDEADVKFMKVDILHLSPPCCYWSPANTQGGPNDQANYESIKTVGATLKKITPNYFTMEQTFGIYTISEFKRHFYLLLNDIHNAGYNCRYKIEDCSKFGVPQQRMRLLIIGAKQGLPLPAFPKPQHGPPGSGLKPFVFVADALRQLERERPNAPYDKYDDIARKRPTKGIPYDPKVEFLKGCVTTGGGENHHYTGSRKYTAREIGALQTFPLIWKLDAPYFEKSISPTKATELFGNAIPPSMAEAMYLQVAQTAEAYKHNLIDETDDLSDLRGLLEAKGIIFRRKPSSPDSSFGNYSEPRTPDGRSLYRYLPRLADNDAKPTDIVERSACRRMPMKRERAGTFHSVASHSSSRRDEDIIRSHFPPVAKRQRVVAESKNPTREEEFIDLTNG